ncbi:MAG: ABC transporter ATP-binding protein [Proteobacteria bacterium]|nr:ABC transporter ATP-binding protein [Pseudomonadota bacterium]
MVDQSLLENNDQGLIIRLQGVSKGFNSSGSRLDVLKDIDYDIMTGDTIAVVGASGIGKSTLLNIVGTLDKPDKGTLYFKGKDVFSYNSDQLAEFRNRSIGFVFQFHHLLPEFTALENVMMPSLIKGEKRVDASENAVAMLIRVGLKERLRHRIGELSGGEQQRVALARALILRPAVLLADEPTGNLDKRTSEKIHALLVELNLELGMTLIVVTHNIDLAKLLKMQLTLVDGRLEEGM